MCTRIFGNDRTNIIRWHNSFRIVHHGGFLCCLPNSYTAGEKKTEVAEGRFVPGIGTCKCEAYQIFVQILLQKPGQDCSELGQIKDLYITQSTNSMMLEIATKMKELYLGSCSIPVPRIIHCMVQLRSWVHGNKISILKHVTHDKNGAKTTAVLLGKYISEELKCIALII